MGGAPEAGFVLCPAVRPRRKMFGRRRKDSLGEAHPEAEEEKVRLLSALFDVALLPFSVARDVLDVSNFADGNKSFTRQRIEKVEDNLR